TGITNSQTGLRPDGATSVRRGSMVGNTLRGAVCGLVNGVCEVNTVEAALKCYLVGYLKDTNAVAIADPVQEAANTTADVYEEIDASGIVAEGYDGAFVRIGATGPTDSSANRVAVRRKGDSDDLYYDASTWLTTWVPLGPN